jgi:hypothetical protein
MTAAAVALMALVVPAGTLNSLGVEGGVAREAGALATCSAAAFGILGRFHITNFGFVCFIRHISCLVLG